MCLVCTSCMYVLYAFVQMFLKFANLRLEHSQDQLHSFVVQWRSKHHTSQRLIQAGGTRWWVEPHPCCSDLTSRRPHPQRCGHKPTVHTLQWALRVPAVCGQWGILPVSSDWGGMKQLVCVCVCKVRI